MERVEIIGMRMHTRCTTFHVMCASTGQEANPYPASTVLSPGVIYYPLPVCRVLTRSTAVVVGTTRPAYIGTRQSVSSEDLK